jgi:RNA polymerase sigma factor (sigma-70 family)
MGLQGASTGSAGQCTDAHARPLSSDDEVQLVRQYRRPLVLFFRRRYVDWSIAEDLAHEALRVMIARIRSGTLDTPEKLSAFVFGTARFVETNHRRDLRRHGDQNAPAQLDDSYATSDPDPEQQVQQSQLRLLVHELLRSLPQARDRQMLWMFYVEGASKEDLLAKFDMKPSQFDNALYRARGRLRELLLQWGFPQ